MPMNIDAAMLEMFRAEVETHMSVLSDGLLALEKHPGQNERFEALMRAAHSIKGAAKIVGLPAAVQVAHAIEDCFVAARKGQAEMSSGLVDVLLEGIDLLARAADVDDSGHVALDADDPKVAQNASRIAAAMRVAPQPAPASVAGARNVPSLPKRTLQLHAPARLDGAWAAAHRDRIRAQLNETASTIQLDLTDVSTIDVAGLGFLSLVASASNTAGEQVVRIQGARPEIERLLCAAGFVQPGSSPPREN